MTRAEARAEAYHHLEVLDAVVCHMVRRGRMDRAREFALDYAVARDGMLTGAEFEAVILAGVAWHA